MEVNWTTIIAGSAGVVGFIEWAKGYFKMPSKWATRTMMPLLCAAVAIVQNGGWRQIAITALLMLAVCQIGYDLIIQSVKNLVTKGK